jgi:hypothetical protein
MIVRNFHCWKKVFTNNQPYLFSNPAVVIVFEVSWYRHAGRQAGNDLARLRLGWCADQCLNDPQIAISAPWACFGSKYGVSFVCRENGSKRKCFCWGHSLFSLSLLSYLFLFFFTFHIARGLSIVNCDQKQGQGVELWGHLNIVQHFKNLQACLQPNPTDGLFPCFWFWCHVLFGQSGFHWGGRCTMYVRSQFGFADLHDNDNMTSASRMIEYLWLKMK